MSCFSIIVFAVIFISNIVVGGPVPVGNFSEDKISAYREVAKQIKESVNFEVDPCVDYYDYICGRFNTTKSLRRSVDFEDFFENKNLFPSDSAVIVAEIKLKNYFESCMTKNEEDIGSFLKHYALVQELKGCSATTYPQCAENNLTISVENTAAKLQQNGVEVLISLKFEQHFKEKFLEISPVKFDISHSERELRQMLRLLSYDEESQSKILTDLHTFEEQYNSALSLEQNDTVIDTNYKDLKELMPIFDWDNYLQTLTGRTLPYYFPIKVNDFAKLKTILQKTKSINEKSMLNFFFCAFLEKVSGLLEQQNSCYNETFLNFSTVVYRLIKDTIYNEELEKYYLDIIRSLVISINSSLHLFANQTDDQVIANVETFLREKYLSNLTKDELNKEFENLDITPKSYLKNALNMYNFKMNTFFNEYFKTEDKELINYFFSPSTFIQSAYNGANKPSSVAFALLGMPLVSDWIYYFRSSHPYSNNVRDCFKRQLQISKDLGMSELHGIEGTEVYVKGFSNWMERNAKLVHRENEIFKEFGFTTGKVFFALTMQNACDYGHSEIPHKIILSTMANLEEFSKEYNCSKGSPMNPEEKCNY